MITKLNHLYFGKYGKPYRFKGLKTIGRLPEIKVNDGCYRRCWEMTEIHDKKVFNGYNFVLEVR